MRKVWIVALLIAIGLVAANSPLPPHPLEPYFFGIFLIVILVLNALVEGGVAYFFLGAKKDRWLLKSVIGINMVSWPVSWFVVAPLLGAVSFGIIIVELFAVIAEGAALYILNKKSLSLSKAMLYSLAMNLSSLAAFAILYLILSFLSPYLPII